MGLILYVETLNKKLYFKYLKLFYLFKYERMINVRAVNLTKVYLQNKIISSAENNS